MKLISAQDVAARDGQPSVKEWIRVTSVQMKMKGMTPVIFDGTTAGKPVYALISNGRWMALCDQPNCSGCEYVDAKEQLFFCMQCANGKSGKARPVKFPKDLAEIEAALLERAMMPVGGGDAVAQAFNARPVNPDLRRDWVPAELDGHPGLHGRIIVHMFGETAAMIRARTEAIKHAIDV